MLSLTPSILNLRGVRHYHLLIEHLFTKLFMILSSSLIMNQVLILIATTRLFYDGIFLFIKYRHCP